MRVTARMCPTRSLASVLSSGTGPYGHDPTTGALTSATTGGENRCTNRSLPLPAAAPGFRANAQVRGRGEWPSRQNSHPDNPLLPLPVLGFVGGGWLVGWGGGVEGFLRLRRASSSLASGWCQPLAVGRAGARRPQTATRPPSPSPAARSLERGGAGGQRRPGALLGGRRARPGQRQSSPSVASRPSRSSADLARRPSVLEIPGRLVSRPGARFRGLPVAVAPPVAPPVAWGAVVCRDVGGWVLSPVCGRGATAGCDRGPGCGRRVGADRAAACRTPAAPMTDPS
ncbi:hypothetical protein P3T27_008192 [Kitasatospora sp. MAA19]|nr:hypothetical protein [Kitasatospora sp. MAA19]